ncbi:MAG: hypothetical protein ABTQ31_19730 [Rhizobiaceae bacterium]
MAKALPPYLRVIEPRVFEFPTFTNIPMPKRASRWEKATDPRHQFLFDLLALHEDGLKAGETVTERVPFEEFETGRKDAAKPLVNHFYAATVARQAFSAWQAARGKAWRNTVVLEVTRPVEMFCPFPMPMPAELWAAMQAEADEDWGLECITLRLERKGAAQ